MAQTYDEGRLRFTFSAPWRVLKWDEHPAYTQGLGRHHPTKAVDFVGEYLGVAWFIEVKDFRGYAIENRERFPNQLADEVADKVRDSLGSMIWACGREAFAPHTDLPRLVQAILQRREGQKTPVVLWVEPGRPLPPEQRAVLTDLIKQRLKWAGVRVLVTDSRVFEPEQIPGLEVSSLPTIPTP
jgi:hypothetical protein